MSTRNTVRCLSVAFLVLFASLAMADAPSLKEIMQGLRDNLVEMTDGLLVDDLDRVKRGAAGIANHAPIAAPQAKRIAATLGPEMAAFKQFDERVHDLAVAISADSIDNVEAVTRDYQAMVTGCLACHAAFKDRVAQALAATP